MMFYPVADETDWSDFVFIMPAVSVGNVGQLAVDLLLATIEVEFVGHLHCDAVLPFVGVDPFVKDSVKLVTSCQVYENKQLKMVIMQQRSPVAKNKRTEFVNFMTDWIKKKNFKRTIFLSSSLSEFQIPNSSSSMYFTCTPNQDSDVKGYLQDTLKWKVVEQRDPFNDELLTDDYIQLPGSGLTTLFDKICTEKEIPLVVLVHYCSEGNNIPDAVTVASSLNKWLGFIQISEWKKPVSWNLLFGNTLPKGLC